MAIATVVDAAAKTFAKITIRAEVKITAIIMIVILADQIDTVDDDGVAKKLPKYQHQHQQQQPAEMLPQYQQWVTKAGL